jgi:Co/Zn/Cd efflux system component
VKKLSANLFVAVAAFLIGLASASALHHDGFNGKVGGIFSAHSDAMGNICANQE